MLDLNYRLRCGHCEKKSIAKLQVGDFRRAVDVRCQHCGGSCQITREEILAILGNLDQFKKRIKV